MNKYLMFVIFILLLSFGITACNMPIQPPATPTLIPSQTPPPTITAAPTETAIPATPTSEFAPFCDPGIISMEITPSVRCQQPLAYEGIKFCVEKKPYNIIYINLGATYQPLTEGFVCLPEGRRNNRQVINCMGTTSKTYEVRVCDPACAAPTAQAAATQCPQGYAYNNVYGCCSEQVQSAAQEEQSCMVIKLDTPKCSIKCQGFKYTECQNHSHSCIWFEGACNNR